MRISTDWRQRANTLKIVHKKSMCQIPSIHLWYIYIDYVCIVSMVDIIGLFFGRDRIYTLA